MFAWARDTCEPAKLPSSRTLQTHFVLSLIQPQQGTQPHQAAALNKEAAALFQFKTTVWCKKPPAPSKAVTAKKRKVGEATSGEQGEVEAAAEEEEEILAQVPLPLPEPEEVPTLRLTRARRVDTRLNHSIGLNPHPSKQAANSARRVCNPT